jgi:E3 ubiquitin-protein ligase UBR7
MAESSTSTVTSTSKEECIEEESNVITMVDVLKEEEELEDDAKAVLGASDDQNCTYSRVNISSNFTFCFCKNGCVGI